MFAFLTFSWFPPNNGVVSTRYTYWLDQFFHHWQQLVYLADTTLTDHGEHALTALSDSVRRLKIRWCHHSGSLPITAQRLDQQFPKLWVVPTKPARTHLKCERVRRSSQVLSRHLQSTDSAKDGKRAVLLHQQKITLKMSSFAREDQLGQNCILLTLVHTHTVPMGMAFRKATFCFLLSPFYADLFVCFWKGSLCMVRPTRESLG